MSRTKPLNRRTFLRGSGTLIALPFLEAMIPFQAQAQMAFPKRLGVFYFPFGTHNEAWAPTSYGSNFTMPANLSAINAYKSRIILPRGLGAHGLPQGSHMAAIPYFTTEPLDGCRFEVRSKSADMMISDYIRQTNPSPQPVVSRYQASSGFSGCYNHGAATWQASVGTYLSWTGTTTAASQLTTPQAVFDRLFTGLPTGGTTTQTDPLIAYRRSRGLSVLDSVLEEAASYTNRVGAADQMKLDQYFTAIREVERTIQADASMTPPPATLTCAPGTRPGTNLPLDQAVKAFLDLAVLGFACDRTRVVSHILAGESGIFQSYPWAGVTGDHHLISHVNTGEGGIASADKPAMYLKITDWYAQQLAYLLGRMQSFKEGDHDLLYNSVLIYGSGMGPTGQSHNQLNIPMVIAGELGGSLRTGQALDLRGQRTSNLWLTILQKFGVSVSNYASSTGTLNLG